MAAYDYASTTGYARGRTNWLDWPNMSTPVQSAHYNRWDQAINDLKALTFNVMDYGAVGDDTTDDTTAIQAALNAAGASSSTAARVWFPPATYKITAALTIPYSPGLKIEGASPTATIKQHTSNTPIFQITTDNTHSLHISELSFDYAVAQSSTNTAACPIYWVGNVSAPAAQFYNNTFERLFFYNCCDCFGTDAAKYSVIWGNKFRDIQVASTVSRSVAQFVSSATSGQPNNGFDKVYVRADAMVGPLFYIKAGETTWLDNIEVNVASLGPTIIQDFSGGNYVVGAMKIETGSYGPTANPLFSFGNSHASFDWLLLATLTVDGTSSQPIFRFVGSAGYVFVRHLDLSSITVSTGTWYVTNGEGAGSGYLKVDAFVSGVPSGVVLTNVGSTVAAKGVFVEDWANERISNDKGDADYTVTIGDPTVIRYATALTAARTVTLPRPDVDGNMFDGLKYRVVRSGGGAFALNINKAPSTLLDSIASGKTGAIEYTYSRAAGDWIQTLKAVA